MIEPVLVKQSFLIALLTAIQAVMPAVAAIACLYATLRAHGVPIDWADQAATIVLCAMILTQPPREVFTPLTSQRTAAVAGILVRWLLLLAALLAVDLIGRGRAEFRPRFPFTWALSTPFVLVVVVVAMQHVMRRVLAGAFGIRRAIFAGFNSSSVGLARRLRENPDMRIELAGFLDDRSTERLGMDSATRLLGPLADVARFVSELRIDVIFVALPIRHVQRVMKLLDDLRDTTASIYYVPDIFVFDLIQSRSSEIRGVPVVAMCETPFYGYRGLAKRLVDIIGSLSVILLALPILLLIGALVKISSPGPVIFKQRRYGLDGREISVYKFRTMRVTEDGQTIRQASRSDERITRVGRFLRRYSLDETPQLINVVQGRMSLVGPRPHAVAHNEQYRKLIKGYMVRHKVLPGITGLAQISGCRGETTELRDMQARVNYDLDYLRHWSLLLDLKILFWTAIKVFRDEKAY